MVIKPTVHLNGTSGKQLLKQNLDAIRAVDAAQNALAEAAPHRRDYYTQDGDGLLQAQVEHRRRMRKLEEIKSELWEIAKDIQDQNDKRERR